jgi:hypothetical protein
MRKALAAAVLVVCAACNEPLAPVGESRLTLDNGLVVEALSLQRGVNQTNEVWLYVQLHNPTNAPLTARLPGSCMLRPRLYRSYTQDLVWDGVTEHPACSDEWRDYSVGTKQTLPVVWEYVVFRDQLGDAVSAGTYNLIAALRPSGRQGPIVEVRAGVVRF